MTILQPVLQPVLRPLLADPLAPSLGDGLTAGTKALFASGEKGVMFDYWLGTNYQDSARTTPVGATNDQIGSTTDYSPNAAHGSASGTARPKWNSAGYALWDGLDDNVQTAAIDLSGVEAVTIVASMRKASDAATAIAINSNSLNNGSFSLQAPSGASANYAATIRGSATLAATTATTYASPDLRVLTLEGRISTDFLRLRADGADAVTGSGDAGTGNLSNAPIVLGARSTLTQFFTGRMYRVLVIGRLLTTTERSTAERWAAQPAGVVIP